VKAVIGFYGAYDMQAQWAHDQMTRPRDQIAEKFLGAAPMTSRKLFFEASPLSYVTLDKNSTRFLLIYGNCAAQSANSDLRSTYSALVAEPASR
jgi:hypothetical protein